MNFVFVQDSRFRVGLSQADQNQVGKERLKIADADGRLFEEQRRFSLSSRMAKMYGF